MRYFLKVAWRDDWDEVSKDAYIATERRAGFYPKDGGRGTIATAGFSDGCIQGRVEYEDGDW